MKYKSYKLDPFQVEAYHALTHGNSVVVSAATGTGKTLIADFVINRFIGEQLKHEQQESTSPRPEGVQVVYTAPLKAISNQKYRQFTGEYGLDSVGILTGDVQINPTAPLVIMTTEIYRNMLVSQDKILDNLRYIIFDEIHYMSDIERGTIWEEAIIYSPEHVKFLCLSATVPNATELAGWIRSIKGHKLKVIEWDKRAVPLKNYLYDTKLGICNFGELRNATYKELKVEQNLRKSRRGKKRHKQWHKSNRSEKGHIAKTPPPNHIALVSELRDKNMLPALLFSFSRRNCQHRAQELAGNFNFSTSAGRSMAQELFKEYIDPELKDLESVQLVHSVVNRGIGVHHAGLLPGLKLIVEKLFAKGHLKALYATETFALGVNMPARTVSFLGLRKYDGFRNRNLSSNEFSQCSGRAGRRGIDEIGYVVSLLARKKFEVNDYQTMSSSPLEPIISQFTLSYNTVINLVKNHPPADREQILKSSFDYYVRKKNRKHMWVMRRYKQFLRTLNNLGYLDGERVTEKGEFASKVYTHELMVSEIFATGLYKKLNSIAIAILLTAIMYEERRNDHFKFDSETNAYEFILSVISTNAVVASELNYMNLRRMCLMVRLWCQGCDFTDLLDITNIEEGDMIHIFRNTLDLARQVLRATDDPKLTELMEEVIEMIDRDVIRVSF
jgi:superfamily II RNA helicase